MHNEMIDNPLGYWTKKLETRENYVDQLIKELQLFWMNHSS